MSLSYLFRAIGARPGRCAIPIGDVSSAICYRRWEAGFDAHERGEPFPPAIRGKMKPRAWRQGWLAAEAADKMQEKWVKVRGLG
jgi:hypothetical protein